MKGVVLIENGSQRWTLHYQNEFLAIEGENKEFLVTTPDIIVVFDHEEWIPIAC